MRLEAVLLVIATVLNGCGRFGFDTTNSTGTDAGDEAPDAAPNEIAINLRFDNALFASVGADIIVTQANGDTCQVHSDATGRARCEVASVSTVLVVARTGLPQVGSGMWTYVDVPPGTTLELGPPANVGELAPTHATVSPYAGAMYYRATASSRCIGANALSTTTSLDVELTNCQTPTVPFYLYAQDAASKSLAGQFATLTAGASSPTLSAWEPAVAYHMRVDGTPAGFQTIAAGLAISVGGELTPFTDDDSLSVAADRDIHGIQRDPEIIGVDLDSITDESAYYVQQIPTVVGTNSYAIDVSGVPRQPLPESTNRTSATWTHGPFGGVGTMTRVLELTQLVDQSRVIRIYYLPPTATSVAHPVLPAELSALDDLDPNAPPLYQISTISIELDHDAALRTIDHIYGPYAGYPDITEFALSPNAVLGGT